MANSKSGTYPKTNSKILVFRKPIQNLSFSLEMAVKEEMKPEQVYM
jgi:hypothetical protein